MDHNHSLLGFWVGPVNQHNKSRLGFAALDFVLQGLARILGLVACECLGWITTHRIYGFLAAKEIRVGHPGYLEQSIMDKSPSARVLREIQAPPGYLEKSLQSYKLTKLQTLQTYKLYKLTNLQTLQTLKKFP